MEEVLEPLQEIEEPAPAELLAEPDVVRPLQPDPLRRLGDLPLPGARRELRDLPFHIPRTSASIHVSSAGSSPRSPWKTGNPESPER